MIAPYLNEVVAKSSCVVDVLLCGFIKETGRGRLVINGRKNNDRWKEKNVRWEGKGMRIIR